MSEKTQATSGAESVASGAENQEQIPSKTDKVAYETYQKVLAEKKARDKAVDDLAAKLKEYEQKDLEAKGKTTELVDSLRTQVKEKEEKLGKAVQAFARKALEAELAKEAQKYGVSDLELLLKVGDLSTIEVNPEDWSINQDDTKRFFETAMTKHPVLFKKQAKSPVDMALVNGASAGEKKSFKDLKTDDLIGVWKSLPKQ